MEHTYWHKQSADNPLFPDILWSRPENKRSAGKLLIIGGNASSFLSVGKAYDTAMKAGAGTVRVILPDSLQKTVSQVFPAAEFAPSNKSGSFSGQALSSLLDNATWADGVLLAGDFGKNSETAILFEKFTNEYKGPLTMVHDSIDILASNIKEVSGRANCLIVPTLSQLRLLAINLKFETPITSKLNLINMVDALHSFTSRFQIIILCKLDDQVLVSMAGKVSSTKATRVETDLAAAASVWWLQNPIKPFEALTTSVLENQPGGRGGTALGLFAPS